MKLAANIHQGVDKRFQRSQVEGQDHIEAKYTFPGERQLSTYGRPSVVRPAEAYQLNVTVSEALVLRPLLEDRGRITRDNPYPVARRQNETKRFPDHDETSPSIAAVSVQSVACSMTV